MDRVSVVLTTPDGAAYVPFARGKMRYFASQWRGGYVSHTLKSEGVTILFELWSKEDRRITITVVGYMESAILDLQDVRPGFEKTYLPPLLRFTPFVAGHSAVLPNAGSRTVADGYESWSAAGCRGKHKTVDTVVGAGTEVHFEHSTADFCEPDQVREKKMLFEKVPSSTYTGKLKLFVQALYGSLRTDYKRNTGSAFGWISLDTGEYTVPPEGSDTPPQKIYVELFNEYPTTGLFTISPGRYLLIEISANDIRYRKMRRRYGAQPAPYDENGEPIEPELAEAYILATLVPSATFALASGPDMYSVVGGGTRLAYGWHFNKSGSEASIVLRRTKTLDGVRVYDGTASTIDGFVMTLYKVTFNYDKETEELSFSISATESGDHIPYLQSKVFYPDILGGGMDLLLPVSPAPWNCYAKLGPAPLYCYYGVDDALHVIRVNNSAFEIIPAEDTATGRAGSVDGSILFGGPTKMGASGPVNFHNRPISYSKGSAGIFGDTFSYKDKTSLVPTPSIYYYYVLGFGGRVVSNFYYEGSVLVPAYDYYFSAFDGASSVHTQIAKDTESVDYSPVCVIPFGDASAFIGGYQRKCSGVFSTTRAYELSNNIMYFSGNPYYVMPLLWAGGGSVTWAAMTDQLSENAERARLEALDGLNSLSSKMFLHAGGGVTTLSEYDRSTTKNTEAFDDRPYQGLFEAAAFGGLYPHIMFVRSSYSGAVQHSDVLPWPVYDPKKPCTGLYGWPDAQYSTAVGWA